MNSVREKALDSKKKKRTGHMHAKEIIAKKNLKLEKRKN